MSPIIKNNLRSIFATVFLLFAAAFLWEAIRSDEAAHYAQALIFGGWTILLMKGQKQVERERKRHISLQG